MQINKLQQEVARLIEVKPAVGRVAEEVGEQVNELSMGVSVQELWEGERWKQYRVRTVEELIKPYDEYYKGIEEVMEELGDAIKKREEEIQKCQEDIVSLRSRITFLHEELARQEY